MHCLCNDSWSYCTVHEKRGSKAMDEIGLIPSLDNCTLVHDFWGAYLKYNNVKHSFCNTHLERELIYTYETTVESDNSIWEQMNQEQLKEDYRYQLLNGGPKNFVRPVHRIVCGGCAKIFYTEVPTKKYCSERGCYLGFWRHKREKRLEKRKDMVCKTCGKTFTPKRSDAVYCSNACRQKAYRQKVTVDGNGSN